MIGPHRLDQLTGDEQELLQDDAAAFVLDALDDEEARDYRAHLSRCDVCAEMVREFGGTASLLALAADDAPDIRDIRTKVVDAATFTRPNRFRQPLGFLAVAATIAALALGSWNVALQIDSRNLQTKLANADAAIAAIAHGGRITSFVAGEFTSVLVIPDDGSQPWLLPGQMPSAPSGHMYQVWGLDGSAPRSLGVFAPGSAIVHLDGPLNGVRQIALTVEPGPKGSPGPTTQPFLIGGI